MGSFLCKETLIYSAFTVDALNTMFSFPLFATKGPKWYLEQLNEHNKAELDLKDADRPSVQALWDIFMVSYEGYFGFTLSTLACMYLHPETLPCFSYSLAALYAYKAAFLLKQLQVLPPGNESNQTKSKFYWTVLFFLPCYGGYSLAHLVSTLKK